MSAAVAEESRHERPVLLFVDDEQRVLKSMRAMFRKEYDVLVANSGAEALELIASQVVDVVISDQRMPNMTGVEVLTSIKERSPATVRILLTGYADLEAIEASMNEAEVFKYLMKPCPAVDIHAAVSAALKNRRPGNASDEHEILAAEPTSNVTVLPTLRKPTNSSVPDETSNSEITAPANAVAASELSKLALGVDHKVDVVVYSEDTLLIEETVKACNFGKTHIAQGIDETIEFCRSKNAGVLVTDTVGSESDLQDLCNKLAHAHANTLVILASERSDAALLINLINSGDVFRFLLKPVHPTQCRMWLTSAANKYIAALDGDLSELQHAQVQSGRWIRFVDWLLAR